MIGTVKLYKPYMNSRKRMVKAMAKIAKQLTELIGNTPLLELTNYEKENELEANLIVKLEYFNPLGSVKDRVGKAMIEDAEEKGILKEVDGTMDMNDVFAAIVKILGE